MRPILDERGHKALRSYCRFMLRYRAAWSLILPGTLCIAAMRLPMPLLTGYIIDMINHPCGSSSLNIICEALVIVIALYVFFNYLIDYLMYRIANSVAIRYKVLIFRHIQELPLSTLTSKETGYLMSRISSDATLLMDLLAQALAIGISVMTLVVAIITMFLFARQ